MMRSKSISIVVGQAPSLIFFDIEDEINKHSANNSAQPTKHDHTKEIETDSNNNDDHFDDDNGRDISAKTVSLSKLYDNLNRQSTNTDKPHEVEQAGKEKDKLFQQTKIWQSRAFWSSIDIYVPILVTLPTLVSSLYLFIQAKSYTTPTYALWVVICIASGEASGAIFEILRLYLKSRFNKSTKFRGDRFFNYFFTSLIALIYGVILKLESVYWQRIWIVTLLPIIGGVFRYALHHKWNDHLSNFLGTLMLCIEIYRITLIGAVLESTGYEPGLFALLMPLLYVEVLWTTALCTFFQDFTSQVSDITNASIKKLSRSPTASA